MMSVNARMTTLPNVLLTGAGFTKNFGGLLGSEIDREVWRRIPHELRTWFEDTRKKYAQDGERFNFEVMYDEARKELSTADSLEVSRAIQETFDQMDGEVIHRITYGVHEGYRIPSRVFTNFVNYFTEQQSRAFIFTLNQDLRTERAWIESVDARLGVPGPFDQVWFENPTVENSVYKQIKLPVSEDDFERIPYGANLILVKLHGSINEEL